MHGRFWADGKEWFLGYEAQRLGMGLRECYAERYSDYMIIMVNVPLRTTRPPGFHPLQGVTPSNQYPRRSFEYCMFSSPIKPLIPAATI